MTTIDRDLLVTATGGVNIDKDDPLKLPDDRRPKVPIQPIGTIPSPTYDPPFAGSGRFNGA